MRYAVVPHAEWHLEEFDAWCEGRSYSKTKLRADAYIWVAIDAGDGQVVLVSGVGLHFGGKFVIVEDFVVAPGTSAKVAHTAARLTLEQLISICVAGDKRPIIHTNKRGIARLITKRGFVVQPVATFVAPRVEVNRWIPVKAPRPRPKSRRRRAKKKSAG